MEWIVKNALNRDTEREHLNKILADIKQAVNSKAATAAAPVQQTTTVVSTPKQKDTTVTLTGVVVGAGKGNTGISINTEFAEPVVEEAPSDGHYYWRLNKKWQPVPPAVLALDYLPNSGYMSWDFDQGVYNAREIVGTTDEIDVSNGTGTADNTQVGLADLTDTATGTFKLITRDAKGRLLGTSDGTTDDVDEGTVNLYYTDARADARVVYGLQQNTSSTYTDSYGVVNTLSIARASDWDDGGLRKVSGGITARARFSSTEEYDAEFTGIGLSTYLYNPAQAGSAYTTTGVQLVGDDFAFNSFSIDKTTKEFLGACYITLQPESIDDPSSGGFTQKIVKVQNKSGTLALTSDFVRPPPLLLAAGSTYTIPENTQVLWTIPIELEAGATIEVLGEFVEVN